jgi:hypothetical protein
MIATAKHAPTCLMLLLLLQVVASMSPSDVVTEYGSLVGSVREGLTAMEGPDVTPDTVK